MIIKMKLSVLFVSKGTGEIYIKASCMNVSKTYSILDSIFLDKAITGNKNNKWVNQSRTYDITVDNEGTHLARLKNGNLVPSTVANSLVWADRLLIGKPYILELDIIEINTAQGEIRIYYNDDGSYTSIFVSNMSTGHYKIIVNDDSIEYIKDNGNPVILKYDTITVWETVSFANVNDIKFANYVIYPI